MRVSCASTVFQVKDLAASLSFYREVLGFSQDFVYGPYAGLHLGECWLHLCAHAIWKRPVGGGAVVVFADDVDEYCATVKARGAKIALEPADQSYGMRDFVLIDPDGNVLTFSCALAKGGSEES